MAKKKGIFAGVAEAFGYEGGSNGAKKKSAKASEAAAKEYFYTDYVDPTNPDDDKNVDFIPDAEIELKDIRDKECKPFGTLPDIKDLVPHIDAATDQYVSGCNYKASPLFVFFEGNYWRIKAAHQAFGEDEDAREIVFVVEAFGNEYFFLVPEKKSQPRKRRGTL